MAELFPLLVADNSSEILNLDQPLADKYHLGYVGDTCEPGIADQLRVESQQPCRLLQVAAGGGLPFQQAASAVQFTDGVHVGYKVVLAGQGFAEFDLQVAARLTDANPIVLGKAVEQLHARLQHAIPAIALGIVNAAVPMDDPFPVEHSGGILPLKVGSHG